MRTLVYISVLLATGLLPIGSRAQFLSDNRWEKQISYLEEQYPTLPGDTLDTVTTLLDSTVLNAHCYRFITSPDKTKFIAFYLAPAACTTMRSLRKEFSNHYQVSLQDPSMDSNTYIAYTVSGMFYDSEWYCLASDYLEFHAGDEEEARQEFLQKTLKEKDFFSDINGREQKKFWLRNEWEPCEKDCLEGFEGKPALVAASSMAKKIRKERILDYRMTRTLNDLYKQVWNILYQTDSLRYSQPLVENECIAFYNRQRDRALLPVIFYDHRNKPWILYFSVKFMGAHPSVYQWLKLPLKPIDWPRGNEHRQVIYDLKQFMPDWTKHTPVIAEAGFWSEHFTDPDLQPVYLSSR